MKPVWQQYGLQQFDINIINPVKLPVWSFETNSQTQFMWLKESSECVLITDHIEFW